MPTCDDSLLLLTGSTGLIGHHVLANLLRRGRRCAVLLRLPLDKSVERLAGLLGVLSIDAHEHVRRGSLVPLVGDLQDTWPDVSGLHIEAVIHGAASTRFSPDSDGEPRRTNVEGTRHLLEWSGQEGIERVHMISSAYSCGRVPGPVPEDYAAIRPRFHNEYEASKWESERLCLTWSSVPGRQLTLYRPSVVVGEYGSGRSPKFAGFYLSARATEFLARSFNGADRIARHSVPLRIRGRAHDCQNIVSVDYVAAMIAAIVLEPRYHGRVYHLSHPDPPSNERIKTALESFFDIGGGRFVDPADFPATGLNEHEQHFYDISRSIEHYFVDTPVFTRGNTAAVEQEIGRSCPSYDEAAIHRLVAYAQSAEWGRRKTSLHDDVSPCATYFESFLPTYVSRSRVARMTGLSTTMRFVIDDEPNGQWVCRFEKGQLNLVRRGVDGIREDFGYRATREVFWEAISGRVHPQDLFLTGRAEVFGNVEQALKMAMILHAFTQEYPCTPAALADMDREA